MPDLAYKMRLLFPLVIATSISGKYQEECGYNPEYTISHLIMRCLKELDIAGVAYLSSRIDDELQFPQGVNVAIPIFVGSAQHEYGDICHCFEMTDPIYFEGVEQCDTQRKCNSSRKSYVNAVYSDGITATIKYFGNRTLYSKSPFACIDNQLTALPYNPA